MAPYLPHPHTPALPPAAAQGTAGVPWTISPWWNNGNGPELGSNVPAVIAGRSPITYPAIWERERETLGYNPRFLPNTVTFDQNNRPVIRVGVHGDVGEHATVYYYRHRVEEAYIQTLDTSGTWVALSIGDVMHEKIPDWNNDRIGSGVDHAEERVAFDTSNDAYTIVTTESHGDFLLHSRDGMTSWDVYALPAADVVSYRIETTASDRPPVIFVRKILDHPDDCFNGVVSIIAPEKNPDGTLNVNSLGVIDLVSNDALHAPSHSGAADVTLTLNNKTHVVYIGTQTVAGQEGTPQYIVTYDHNNHTVTTPVLLATTLNSGGPTNRCGIDPHNGPAIVADSDGFLHVVLGSHQHSFKYTVSKRPNDATEWEAPVELSNPTGKETYVSLVIDKADTLHLVSRMNDEDVPSLHYTLHYMRKKRTDRAWVDIGELVIPKPTHYSIWYHKLTIDRRGTLFLVYFYYSHDLSDQEYEDYIEKWDDEEVTKEETNAHDPVLLISSDGGGSWKIATTLDITDPWSRLAVDMPAWSDARGWHKVANYATIQTAVVNDELYLLARADAGMHTWKFDAGNNTWMQLVANMPAWSDARGWHKVANYATIQTAVVNDELYLLGRADNGMHTWKFDAGNNTWMHLVANMPAWHDATGWHDVTNYATIQTAVVNNELYLLARADNGIHTWARRSAFIAG